jgi:hypothetical protein
MRLWRQRKAPVFPSVRERKLIVRPPKQLLIATVLASVRMQICRAAVQYCSAQNRELRNEPKGLSRTRRLIRHLRHPPSSTPTMKKETCMTPRAFRRPLNLAMVLVICAVILSARLLWGYAYVENAPPVQVIEVPQHPDELPPVW